MSSAAIFIQRFKGLYEMYPVGYGIWRDSCRIIKLRTERLKSVKVQTGINCWFFYLIEAVTDRRLLTADIYVLFTDKNS